MAGLDRDSIDTARPEHNGAEGPELAIVAEGVTKTYRVGLPPAAPGWVLRFMRLLPGLRDETRTGLAHEFNLDDTGPPPQTVAALRDVSFDVAKGSALGVTGPVGSGKSTLLKILTRLSPPTSGTITVNGRVAPSLEAAPMFLDASTTGRNNAYRLARLFGVPRSVVDRRLDDIFAFAELTPKMDYRVNRYSSGEHRRLGYSIALNLEADILVADDRTFGSDTTFAEHVRWRIASTREDESLTLVLVSNDYETLSEFCTDVIWLEEGQIVDRVPAQQIAEFAEDLRYTHKRGGSEDGEESPDADEPALNGERKALLEWLIDGGLDYAEAAERLDSSEVEARALAHAAVRSVVPPSVSIAASRREELIEYVLGQLDAEAAAELGESISRSIPDRAWVGAVIHSLTRAGFESLPEVPAEPPEEKGPTPGPAAVALLRFVRVADGDARAEEVLEAATKAAVRREQSNVKWVQIAEAAGIEHERAKGIANRMLAEEDRQAGVSRKRSVFNEHLAITSVEVLTAEGEAVETVRVDEDVTIRIVLEIASEDLPLRCSIRLTVEGSERARFVHPDQFVIPRPGRYLVAADVPPSTFDEARYEGHVSVQTKKDGRKGVVELPGAFEIEAYDPNDPDDRDEDWGRNIGDVEWSVALLQAAGR